jgi:putative phosphoesterase
MRIALLADTHAPRRWRGCPPALASALAEMDLILHAGDVCTAAVLDELASYAPVHVVLGNNDGSDVASWGASETLELELEGVRVAMVHETGAAAGRGRRMRARFPDADLLVFGHSHIPLDETHDGLRLINPGSPTDRRRQPHGTFGVIDLVDGAISSVEIRALPGSAARG